MSAQPEFTSNHYDRLHYRCVDCGRSEAFEGLPVTTRNPIREDADCTMCTMRLVQPERYWSEDLTPDRVDVHAWGAEKGTEADGDAE